MFYSYFERKYDKILTLNIVHFPNFEISTSLLLAPHSNSFKILQAPGACIRRNTVCTFEKSYSEIFHLL